MINAQVPRIYSNQMRREWNQVFTGSPRGKTLLVVGLGEMGGAMAKAGRTLGMRVLGIRRTPSPHPHAEKVHGIRDLKKLLPKADVVVVAAPLTPESRRLIGRTELALMKPGAGLINIGRGQLQYINSNRLIRYGQVNATVQKTGFINESGHNMVLRLLVHDRRPVIVTMLGSGSADGSRLDGVRIAKWLNCSLN
jgi:S-adenosylhomocysteine hydrolase